MIGSLIAAVSAACTGAPSLVPSAIVSNKLGTWIGVANRGDQAVVLCIHSPLWLGRSGAGTVEASPHECRSAAEKHFILPGGKFLMQHYSPDRRRPRFTVGARFFVIEFTQHGAESERRIECTAPTIAQNIQLSTKSASWSPLVVTSGTVYVGVENTAEVPSVITELQAKRSNAPRTKCSSGPRYIVYPGDTYFQGTTELGVAQFSELSGNNCTRTVTFDFRSVHASPHPRR